MSKENENISREYNQRIKNSIVQYVKIKFQEDNSQWIEGLNEKQLLSVHNRLYVVNGLEELKEFI
ncbi:MAG: hypothetical protein ACI4SR_04985 [Faecalibacillus sp.]